MEIIEVTLDLLEGFGISLLIFFITLLFSLPLGLIITFGSMSKIKIIKYIVRGFIWIIRGTSLMLQVIIVFNGPGLWLDISIKNFRLLLF